MFSPVLVHEFLKCYSDLTSDKEALICSEERWTYGALNKACEVMADFLIQAGLGYQDRAVVFLDNSAEAVIALYSILRAGGVFIIVNSTVKPRKLEYILRDSGAKVLITDVAKSAVIQEAAKNVDGLKTVWVGNPARIPSSSLPGCFSWTEALERPSSATGAFRATSNNARSIDQDLAALIYTSGSTGEPKGVMSSHFNMVSAARSIIEYLENTSEDKILNVLPLSFDYGLYQVLMTFMFGGAIVIEKSFAFPVKILECIQRERITGFPIVPTIAALLLRMGNLASYDLSSLRYLTNTAAVLPVEHIRKLQKTFHPAKLYSMFGLTECKRVSYLPPEELDFRPKSVGKAIPNCQVIVADENGDEVAPGVIGELIVRGSNVMQGYWNAPELTAKTFRQGRRPGETLLYSGDLFKRDEEGFLYFIARRDEQIKTKGERVNPKEIENIVCELPGIVEAAVVGVPDEILGQAVKCYAVCSPGSKITEREIIKYCSDNLEPFMVPKYVEILPDLPRTAHGKTDKNALKERVCEYEKAEQV